MLLAITKFELTDIRKAILAASKREEGYQSRLSDGLRVINAILSKGVEVVPINEPEDDDEDLTHDVDWEEARLYLERERHENTVQDFIEEQENV